LHAKKVVFMLQIKAQMNFNGLNLPTQVREEPFDDLLPAKLGNEIKDETLQTRLDKASTQPLKCLSATKRAIWLQCHEQVSRN